MSLRRVENAEKYRTADQFYWQYRDSDGTDYLFSQNQLDVAKRRAEKNPEDLQDVSWIDTDGGTFTIAAIIGMGLGVMATVCISMMMQFFGG